MVERGDSGWNFWRDYWRKKDGRELTRREVANMRTPPVKREVEPAAGECEREEEGE